MWTESRYPNNAALMARPLLFVSAANAEAVASVGRAACDRSSSSTTTARTTTAHDAAVIRASSQHTSGGKVTPADGQEHPRTEL